MTNSNLTALTIEHNELREAVIEFLDEMHACDETGERLGWPDQLVRLVGWLPPR